MRPFKSPLFATSPSGNSFQRFLEQAINQISHGISMLLKTVSQIYESLSIGFLLETEYIHKVVMSMICPVQLRIQYNLEKTHYFTRTAPLNLNRDNGKRPKKAEDLGQKMMSEQQQELLNKDIIKNEFRQDLLNHEKSKNEAKQRLKQKLKEKIQVKNDKEGQIGENQNQGMDIQIEPLINNANYTEQHLSQTQKNEIISDWIRQETKQGRNIRTSKLIQKIMAVNNDFDQNNARRWFNSYLKRVPEITDLLTFSGNLHLVGNIKVKGEEKEEDDEIKQMEIKMREK